MSSKFSKKISDSKTNSTATGASSKDDAVVEVLYQKMGARWFSFFVIDEEVYMGAIPDEAIAEIQSRSTPKIGK